MRVYVAGSSSNYERAISVTDALHRVGIETTYDWCTQVAADRAAGRTDADLTPRQAAEIRSACYAGVRAATVVLWLSEGSEGAGHETGYAIGRRIPVIVVGEGHAIFGPPAYPDEEGPIARFRTDARAVEHLAWRARERRCA